MHCICSRGDGQRDGCGWANTRSPTLIGWCVIKTAFGSFQFWARIEGELEWLCLLLSSPESPGRLHQFSEARRLLKWETVLILNLLFLQLIWMIEFFCFFFNTKNIPKHPICFQLNRHCEAFFTVTHHHQCPCRVGHWLQWIVLNVF